MEDLRTDFYKFLDAIKPLLEQKEFMDIVRTEDRKETLDLLRTLLDEEEKCSS